MVAEKNHTFTFVTKRGSWILDKNSFCSIISKKSRVTSQEMIERILCILGNQEGFDGCHQGQELGEAKGAKRRDRHKIIFCESKKTEPKSVSTGKLCGSRLLEIKQKGKLDDRMRCRRDSVLKLPHPHLQLP